MTQQPGGYPPQGPQDQPPYGQPVPYQQPGYQQGYQQPGYQQPGYGPQQPVYAYQPSPPTNTMAIVALVLALTVAPGGLICGIIARKQIKETGESGDGLALAGMIIGGIITGIYVLVILAYVIFFIIAFAAIGTAGS